MKVVVKINGVNLEEFDRDYCHVHKKWIWAGDEGNCCALEKDYIWETQDRWAEFGVKMGRLSNADKWHFFFLGR